MNIDELNVNELNVNDKDEKVECIVVKYIDGTERTVTKGSVVEMSLRYDDSLKDNMLTTSMECCNMTGKDMVDFFYSMACMIAKLEDKYND